MLQKYHEAKLPTLDLSDPGLANLFSVLGTVGEFLGTGHLNRADLQIWLYANKPQHGEAINRWLPTELDKSDRKSLLVNFVIDLISSVDLALGGQHDDALSPEPERGGASGSPPQTAAPTAATSSDEEAGGFKFQVQLLI